LIVSILAIVAASVGDAAADQTRPPPPPVQTGPVTSVNYGQAFSVIGDEGANLVTSLTYYDEHDDLNYKIAASQGRIVLGGTPPDEYGRGCYIYEYSPGFPYAGCWPVAHDLQQIEVSLGAGNDIFESNNPRVGTSIADLGPGDDRAQIDGYETVLGGDGNDFLNKIGHAIVLESGGAGNDTMIGIDSVDHLKGDAGNDRLVGKDGADLLDGGPGHDVCIGGPNREHGEVGKDRAIHCEVVKGIP
jgi:Ca2+-binding RTX toxin-like protein